MMRILVPHFYFYRLKKVSHLGWETISQGLKIEAKQHRLMLKEIQNINNFGEVDVIYGYD